MSTAAATAATGLLWPANRSVIVGVYYLAVIASAIYGNRRATVLAIALSALSTSYFFLTHYDAFSLTIEGAYVLVIFTLVSSALVVLIERLKANERKLRGSDELFGRAFRAIPSGLAISRVSDGRYVETLVDVTDRKLAEDALHEQAMLVANAQRIGRMGSWSLDLRTGRLDWSDATCDLFGITPAEFEGTFTQGGYPLDSGRA